MYKGYAAETAEDSPKKQEIDLEDLLFFGCEDNDADALRDILAAGEVSPTCYNYEGFTPLLAAVCNGYMDCIEVLLQYSVDVDQQDMNTGCTPLHVASQWGYTDITKLLIEHKATIEAGLWDTDETPLYVAALEGNADCFQALMDAGANTKIEISTGENPLYIAAQMGHINIAEIILSQTEIPVDHGTGGYTPLMIAAVHGHKEMVQVLHEAGAKIDATDKDGCTSLHLASNEGHCDVVHLLVERKCAVDQTQSDGATPLFLASQEGHHHVAQILLKRKAEIDLTREDGFSPLAIAISYGHIKSARVLLAAKADFSLRCHVQGKSCSAIDIARLQEDSEMMLLLAQHSPKSPAPPLRGMHRSLSAEGALSQLAKKRSVSPDRSSIRRVHSTLTMSNGQRGRRLPPLQQTIWANHAGPGNSALASASQNSSAAMDITARVRANSAPRPAYTPHPVESPPVRDGGSPVTIPFLPELIEHPKSDTSPVNDPFSPPPARPKALDSPNLNVDAGWNKRIKSLSSSPLNSPVNSHFAAVRPRSMPSMIPPSGGLAGGRLDANKPRAKSADTSQPTPPPGRFNASNVPKASATRPRPRPPPGLQLQLSPAPFARRKTPFLQKDDSSPSARKKSPFARGRPPPLQNSPFTPAGRPPPLQNSPFTPAGRSPPLHNSPFFGGPSPPPRDSLFSPHARPPRDFLFSPHAPADSPYTPATSTPVDSILPPPMRSQHLEWSCDAMALPAGKHQELPLSISNRAILRYRFDTKGGDIGFFITLDQFDGQSSVLVESMRHQCHLTPTQGEVVVEGAGTARLVWDNSYSWLSSKTLSYVVQLENISDDKDYIVDRSSSLAKLGGGTNDDSALALSGRPSFDDQPDIPSPLSSPIIKVHNRSGLTSSDSDREDVPEVPEEPGQWDQRCTIS